MISQLGQQILAASLPPVEIEVLELDEYLVPDQKDLVRPGTIVIVRKGLKDGEEAYTVHAIEGKKLTAQIGTIDKKSVLGNDLVSNTPYIVTADLRNSEKLTEKRKSAKAKGMVRAHLVADIIDEGVSGGGAGRKGKK